MKYHSLTIRPNNIYVQESMENDTIIKSVSLTPCVAKDSIRSSLIAAIDGEEATICNLLTNKMESKTLNLPLTKGVRIELRTEGENEIDVLFLEMDETEGVTDNENAVYKTIQIAGNTKQVIDESKQVRVLNVSIADPDTHTVQEPTRVVMRRKREEVTIADLEVGIKECEVVDIQIDDEVEIEVIGLNRVDLLVLLSERREEGECNAEDCGIEECEGSKAVEENTSCHAVQHTEERVPADSITSSIDESCTCGTSQCKNCTCKTNSSERKRKCSDLPCETAEQTESLEISETPSKKTKLSEDVNEPSNEQTLTAVSNESECSKKQLEEIPENEDLSNAKIDIKTISDGIGRLVGKKSFISAEYTVSGSDTSKESFNEVVLVRRFPEHSHLKYFSNVVKGSREGAVFKATVKTDKSTKEVVLNVGKIKTGQ
ncbi:hypothetical protein NEIG_01217 [Nematocida sp. ERTm5]|nr:hypothetical protein NEIG_01217 [Nematocida sp. ERTm5]